MLTRTCPPQDLDQILLQAIRVKSHSLAARLRSQQRQAGLCWSAKGEEGFCAKEAEEYACSFGILYFGMKLEDAG